LTVEWEKHRLLLDDVWRDQPDGDGCMRNSMLLFFMMLTCGSANGAMYSCADENGARTLRNNPCENGDKQEVIERKVEPSHSIINSTGKNQSYRSMEPEKYIYIEQPRNVAADTQSVAGDTQSVAGNNSPANEACERRRKELAESNYNATTMAGALIKRNIEKAYERDCLLGGQSNATGRTETQRNKRPSDATFTGRFEITQSGELNCQYTYNGQDIWKIYRGFCPSITTGSND
jgi:hypothetical protein